jgi:hypothetical protein
MDTKAWLIEEFSKDGQLVWKMISFFEPDSLEWMRDIRGKKHNLVISELGVITSKKINGVEKKYDSSKFVVGL